MNKLQETEFNMLKTFIDICDQLGLNYFLVCGTALGAAKYQGFIPWDDDVDVALYREEYEVFCKEAPKLLPEGYFLQTYKTDKNYPNIFAKIRNSNTTYIEKSASELDINHGIYIDVFPLDGYPKNEIDIKKLERKKKILKLLISSVFKIKPEYKPHTKLFFKVERALGIHKRTSKFVCELEKELSRWKIEDTDLVCNHGNWQGKLEYAPKWHYGNGTWATFEGLKVRIPENYDAYLTQKYKNWREDLPKEQQQGHHYYEVCDYYRPYTEYFEYLQNGKIVLKELNPFITHEVLNIDINHK